MPDLVICPPSCSGGGFSGAAKLALENDQSSFWIVEYVAILQHALIHKNDMTDTNMNMSISS
jgi:hypothetical protein